MHCVERVHYYFYTNKKPIIMRYWKLRMGLNLCCL